MSRRVRREAVNFAEVVLKCPHGHSLCSVVATDSGIWRLNAPLRDGQSSASERVTTGEKIKARCPACRAAGRQPDYQASWGAVAAELAIARDTRCERRVLEIG